MMTTRPIIAGIAILLLVSIAACNPLRDKRGGEGQACYADGTCEQGLECWQNLCHPACDTLQPECSVPDTDDQGFDLDGDGWGRCCDCDDTDASISPEGIEICNGVDDDCNRQVDEGFDADGDESTTCGGDCDDTDREVSPGQSERCDGKDNNCDGATDNGVDPRACPLTEGVCAPARSHCRADGTWSGCDYGPAYTPNVDDSCDGADNDCDGFTDEDTIDRLSPEVGDLATDGIDNNCNGLVDEPGGAMVPIANMPGTWIDAFEVAVFDNPGCEGDHFGQALDDYPPGWPASGQTDVTLYACSLPGVIPSGHLSWHRAKRACQAQGKDLCTITQWSTGCYGGILQSYPYGPQFVPGACNDPHGDEQVAPTGSFPGCVNESGVYDQSGNLAEWIQDGEEWSCPGNPLAVGFHYRCEFCTCGSSCGSCQGNPDEIEHLSGCYVWLDPQEAYPAGETRAYLGTRCCYQPD